MRKHCCQDAPVLASNTIKVLIRQRHQSTHPPPQQEAAQTHATCFEIQQHGDPRKAAAKAVAKLQKTPKCIGYRITNSPHRELLAVASALSPSQTACSSVREACPSVGDVKCLIGVRCRRLPACRRGSGPIKPPLSHAPSPCLSFRGEHYGGWK